MSDEVPESVDLWDVLEEAERTVERWPPWQQRYDADIYYDDEPGEAVLQAVVSPPSMLRICTTSVH